MQTQRNIFDRTNEFQTLISQLSPPQQTQQKTVPMTKKEMIQEIKQFNSLTTNLFKNINEITHKLSRLTELAKSISLFEEEQTAPQIQKLTNEIHIGLQNVNAELKTIEKTKSEIEKKYNMTGQNENHREIVCKHLNYLVKNTSKTFSDVLKIRADSIKEQEKKKMKYASLPTQNNQPYQRNINQFSFQDNELSNDETSIDIPQSTSALLSTEHLEQRVQGVQNIERMLNDLVGLYNHITFLVKEQDEMVQRIDDNVEESVFNIEEGHNSLQEAFASISSNRGLIVKSLLIILFFAVVFIVFFL